MTITELQAGFCQKLQSLVQELVQGAMGALDAWERGSLSAIQKIAQAAARATQECVYEAWKEVLVAMSEALGASCGKCGRQRKRRWRHERPMKVGVVGQDVKVPNLYLECRHCKGAGLSVLKLLTGLRSGDASEELKLLAGYSGAEHSYRQASQAMEAHHGQAIERMKIRRMALEIEKSAMEFAAESRSQAMERLEEEGSPTAEGPPILLLEADGGKVRTGELQALEPDDPGYGKKTAKREVARRKRPAQFREVLTMDVREPGEVVASALDVMVPVLSEEGERERRMLALAARRGMTENTEMIGLGDMGSGLASAFSEAFEVINPSSRWYADWKHTKDYVSEAKKALLSRTDLDAQQWAQELTQAIWDRDEKRRDGLLEQVQPTAPHEVERLPDERKSSTTERCPVHALTTYLNNNWQHMHFATLRERQLPIVSARAEAHVRDRTKSRFAGPGVWRIENLEPKATLRSLIAEGRWHEFRAFHLEKNRELFHQAFLDRLENAVASGRLQKERVSLLFPSYQARSK